MLSEKDGTRAKGAYDKVAQGGFDIAGTPYAAFIDRYFETGST